ncbi:ankyrin repeat [Fusarium albosuccineum]|uniref:Ankyrin repeat n=1 Tax=Fusarium albosuccineum TaxID=1237068 RepID=A0A8H4P6I1_9HYPO|nr:ankyrin repeat [Fusarium albosuccineum]
MPQHLKWLGMVILVCSGVARADSLDDFTNNLFTDLAPILALFGERVTMQFMSQALGWADCIALAMAPLGILTIIVSAIRVGGPMWLKAIVGRAKENISAAEIELMSSTSREVCELYNGKSIVRCQGTAPVWEYICLFPKGPSSPGQDVQFITLDQAVERGLLNRIKGSPDDSSLTRENSSKGSTKGQSIPQPGASGDAEATGTFVGKMKGLRSRLTHLNYSNSRPSRDRDVELQHLPNDRSSQNIGDSGTELGNSEQANYLTVIRDTRPDAPNISLNLQNSHDRLWIRLVAALGIILQTAVLVFFGLMVYHPKLKPSFQRDEGPVGAHSFPLAAGGTLILVLGLLLCGHVVEGSTEEEQYETTTNFDVGMYWLQQNQIVADQFFESYATFSRTSHLVITISRRKNALSDSSTTGFLETRTTSGAIISILGFMLQFMGLRAMNSAASLAQLGAVAIMTTCRALVRPGFPRSFVKSKLCPSYELDWLAWKLATSDPMERISDQSENDINAEKQHVRLGSWTIPVGSEAKYHPLGRPVEEPKTEAQKVLTMSRGLYKLASFQGKTAPIAINLALAIERTLNTLFPPNEIETTENFRWYLVVVHKRASDTEEATQKVWFDMVNNGTSWRAPADRLDAALSLLVYTAREENENVTQNQTQQSSFVGKEDNDSWLRSGLPPLGLRLLGPKNKRLTQDLRWWTPESLVLEIENSVKEVPDSKAKVGGSQRTSSNEADSNNTSSRNFEKNRLVGHSDFVLSGVCKSNKGNISIVDEKHSSANGAPVNPPQADEDSATREEGQTTLAIETSDSLEVLYAKDLLFSFLFSAAKTLEGSIPGKAELRPSGTGTNHGSDYSFRNNTVAELVEAFSELKFGDEHEALLSIIIPLSITETLPFPQTMFDSVSAEIVKPRLSQYDDSRTHAVAAILRQTSNHAAGSKGIWESSVVLLLEVLAVVEAEIQFRARLRWLNSSFRSDPDLKTCIDKTLGKSLHRQLWTQLKTIYLRQRRPTMIEECNEYIFRSEQDSNKPQSQPIYPKSFNVTKLHELAMNAVDNNDQGSTKQRYSRGSDEEGDFTLINERDICNWTPLHYAAAAGNVDLLALLHRGHAHADPTLKDFRGYTALHCAFEQGNPLAIDSLIDLGFRIDAQGFDGVTPIHLAARKGNTEALDYVFDYPPQRPSFESLRKQLNLAKKLKDVNGHVPLHWAAMGGQTESLTKLHDDLNVMDQTGWTSLHMAVIFDKLEVVRKLCNLSANKNLRDHLYRTALYIACSRGKLEAVQILLDAKAGTELPGDDGFGPLHVAAINNHTEVTRALLKAGANASAASNKGWTPLHRAARGLRPEATKLLLEEKVDSNVKDKEGRTPMFQMVFQNYGQEGRMMLETTKVLVEGGGDPLLEDNGGITPIEVAREREFIDVVKYLELPPEEK